MAYDAEIEPVSRDLLVLRHARELIAKGWVRATMSHYNQDGRMSYCTLGALQKALTELGEFSIYDAMDVHIRLTNRLDALARRLGFLTASMAVHWNDNSLRQHAEVVACFDRAIAKLEEGHVYAV